MTAAGWFLSGTNITALFTINGQRLVAFLSFILVCAFVSLEIVREYSEKVKPGKIFGLMFPRYLIYEVIAAELGATIGFVISNGFHFNAIFLMAVFACLGWLTAHLWKWYRKHIIENLVKLLPSALNAIFIVAFAFLLFLGASPLSAIFFDYNSFTASVNSQCNQKTGGGLVSISLTNPYDTQLAVLGIGESGNSWSWGIKGPHKIPPKDSLNFCLTFIDAPTTYSGDECFKSSFKSYFISDKIPKEIFVTTDRGTVFYNLNCEQRN